MTAAYSPRPNTAAIWEIKFLKMLKKRLKEINQLVDKISKIKDMNNIESVLIEALNPKNPSQLMGRTRTNRLTFVKFHKIFILIIHLVTNQRQNNRSGSFL